MAVTKTQVLGWNLQAFSDIATDADKITESRFDVCPIECRIGAAQVVDGIYPLKRDVDLRNVDRSSRGVALGTVPPTTTSR
ncbi:hypothetical protein C5E45_21445 [Nocardia nova]|uniref:Uncharacterized protein n=1 Tax=Nocardia nova TaxID=37330 RepID=A0A2S6AM18_9NOCA|nr:hypothetical protein C5E41_05935 [Nocardia nova]PPJ36281.1 hypothetical protein C5E45_21445 [Nocardia nova]